MNFRRIVSVFGVLALLFTVATLLPTVSGAKVDMMPKDLPNQKALQKLKDNQVDFDIFLLSEGSEKTLGLEEVDFKPIDDLKNISSNKKYKSIWISESNIEEFSTEEGKKEINENLDKGYSVFYLGLDDINMLNKLFKDGEGEEIVDDDNGYNPKIGYLTKNKKDEVFVGHILSDKEYNHPRVLKGALASLWNRKNDWDYTRKPQTEETKASLINKVSASSGEFYDVGSNWDNVFGWNQYKYETDYGYYVEWKAAYYLTDPDDSNEYFALAFDGSMDPDCPSGCYGIPYSWGLNYETDADSDDQNNKLRTYAPTQDPDSNTYSFNIGADYSQSSGATAGVGASWDVEDSELSFDDNSSPYNEVMDIYFDYNTYFEPSDYAQNTSWQNASFIIQTENGNTTDVILDNHREATFKRGDSNSSDYDSVYDGWNTIVSAP